MGFLMVLGVSARLKSESLTFGKMTFINGRRGFMKTREFCGEKGKQMKV